MEDAPILIVDDHEANLVVLEVVLGTLGHRIVRATSGTAALKEVLACEFAVILLDVMMPELNGFETASLIRGRKRSASTPIVFLTANNVSKEDVINGYQVGAADYVTKPFDPVILRAKVQVFVELHRARRQLAESRAAEERARAYRTLAERIPQQVWTATPDGALDYINPIVLDYFAQPSEAILGAGWLSVVHPDDAAAAVARWARSLAAGVPYEIEFRLRRHDGEYRWHLGRATAERDLDGSLVRWFGTNTDIHDQKRSEADLVRAIKSRDDMLATVSHDLRGPLGSISLASEMLEPTAESISRNRQITTRSVAQMEHLIRDLLDMASIESGHLSVDPTSLVIEDVVAEALDSIHPVAAAKVINVDTDVAAPKAAIHGDPKRLLQVFSNILGNAVKFTPPSGRVSIRVKSTDDRYVEFAISDSGPGIKQEELPFVFDRFWQAKDTAKAGTGLGLAICKGIVKQHGGSIWVESQLGAGTTFYFTMPIAAL